ncbi:MAG TPA: ROK family protein [Candidatus Saccharimonadales bacterium]|nr:ROK family protein [Candidatus Saccharimonadales bacterium]
MEEIEVEAVDYAIGFDLGGSSIKAISITEAGTTISKSNVSFDPHIPMDWARTMRSMLVSISTEASAEFPGCAPRLGVSAPGLAARDGKSIAFMPGRLQGLEGLVWGDYLQSTHTVPVLNDAHAALLGEAWCGAAQGFKDVFLLTLGTGVGGAALVDGRLLRGHIGRGGHLGHTCLEPEAPPDITGMPGALEDAIGNCTIRQRSNGAFPTTHALVDAYKAGDALAARVWLKSVKALACGIGSFINVLDPEAVIVGGGIARSGSALFEPLQDFLDQVEWRPGGSRVKILPAKLGEFAGAYGAAANALGKFT